MKILYALWNYPQYSETYIATEISFALRSGVEVEVWSQLCRHPQIHAPVRVHRGTLTEAVKKAKPDLIHVHYLEFVLMIEHELPSGIPVTVRGHSFDWSIESLAKVSKTEKVKKIFLFPHFAAQAKGNSKVMPLSVAYDSTIHVPSSQKDRALAVRLAAGLPTKGLSKFLEIARACNTHQFTLVVSSAGGADGFRQSLEKERPANVRILGDISETQAVEVNARAGIYIDTYDPSGHPFGMPISIVEAMATGSLVLVEGHRDALDYVGNGGLIYKDVQAAARAVQESVRFEPAAWDVISAAAIERARFFQDKNVLPALIEEWKRLTQVNK